MMMAAKPWVTVMALAGAAGTAAGLAQPTGRVQFGREEVMGQL
jgi:hypothetical protein